MNARTTACGSACQSAPRHAKRSLNTLKCGTTVSGGIRHWAISAPALSSSLLAPDTFTVRQIGEGQFGSGSPDPALCSPDRVYRGRSVADERPAAVDRTWAVWCAPGVAELRRSHPRGLETDNRHLVSGGQVKCDTSRERRSCFPRCPAGPKRRTVPADHLFTWVEGNSAQLSQVMEHLASQGYVVAAPQHHDTAPFKFELVDRPLDIMLVLDGVAAISDGDLAGMINTNNVGLMGYSLGGAAASQMLGLVRDPAHFAAWCAEHAELALPDCVPELC